MEVDNLQQKVSEKEVPGYSGLWSKVFAFLYLILAGFTCYSSVILYEQFVEFNNKAFGTFASDLLLSHLDTPSVFYFSLTIIISINAFICSYLFFIKDVNNYKILLFNCILGLSSFMLLIPDDFSLQTQKLKST